MMHILSLVGSYRKNGNTAQVVALIEARLRALAAERGEPIDVETVYLGHRSIGTCRGCRACFNRGEAECPLRDDAAEIKAKVKAADGIIAASPVYVDDVSGITKVWIDRLAHVCHRPEFAGKCVYAVATTGSSPTSHTLATLSRAWQLWGACIVGSTGFKTGASMGREEIWARYGGEIDRIARSLHQSIGEEAGARPSFVSLMTFRIQQMYWQREPVGSLDRSYWDLQGWTDPRREYYIPHRASRLKTAAARTVGQGLARFVT